MKETFEGFKSQSFDDISHVGYIAKHSTMSDCKGKTAYILT